MPNTRMSVEDVVDRVEILGLFAKYAHAVDRYEFDLFDEDGAGLAHHPDPL